ncbi:hypothetical protein [Mycolicibacterium sp. CH28]
MTVSWGESVCPPADVDIGVVIVPPARLGEPGSAAGHVGAVDERLRLTG